MCILSVVILRHQHAMPLLPTRTLYFFACLSISLSFCLFIIPSDNGVGFGVCVVLVTCLARSFRPLLSGMQTAVLFRRYHVTFSSRPRSRPEVSLFAVNRVQLISWSAVGHRDTLEMLKPASRLLWTTRGWHTSFPDVLLQKIFNNLKGNSSSCKRLVVRRGKFFPRTQSRMFSLLGE